MRFVSKKPVGKPRLLIVLNRFVIGGQAVDTIPLAWYLKPDFDILILYGQKEKDEIEADFLLQQFPGLDLKKINLLRRSINPLIDVFAFFRVLSAIVAFKTDIIHTHGAKSGFIGRLAAWFAGVPVIIHTFHGHFFHSYFSKNLSRFIAGVERTIGHFTTCAVALSETQKNELVGKYRILPSEKVEIIPLGLVFTQVNNPALLRQAFRKKYNLQVNDVAIGIVGRIVAVKNHSFFIDVIKETVSSQSAGNGAFFIIGDGDLKEDVQKEMQQKGIQFNNAEITSSNRVVFTSWLTKMYEVMNGLDVIVLTSLNEGTPLSIIEAEFFRKPVISTNVGGVKDTMINGKTGFLIDSGDLNKFSQKVSLLIENKRLREEMGEEGYQFASKKFSKQKEINATKQFYLRLLKEKNLLF